jgi:hypothetical protein
VASVAITEWLILAKTEACHNSRDQEGGSRGTSATVKVFIDIFIGVWAFVLAWIWSSKIEGRGEAVSSRQIWERFPKFVLGYMGTFFFVLLVAWIAPGAIAKLKAAMAEASIFRSAFFVMTFFTIGVVSNFRKLWEEGIGRLAAVYVLCLFGFIIWVGLAISWIFFRGLKPPQI